MTFTQAKLIIQQILEIEKLTVANARPGEVHQRFGAAIARQHALGGPQVAAVELLRQLFVVPPGLAGVYQPLP